MEKPVAKFSVELESVDEAAKIMVAHTNAAMREMSSKGLDACAGVQAVVQMSLRLYADLIDDDEEAIRQTRKFLADWERDVIEAPAGQTH